MKNKEIHELINLKERRLEVEVELGVSSVDDSHLTKMQVEQINHDLRCDNYSFEKLNRLNQVIQEDEQIICDRH